MGLAKKYIEYTFNLTLVDSADPSTFKDDPTLAAGDFKISKDGGAFTNITNLPTVAPSGSPIVRVVLTSTEMSADEVIVLVRDVAGAEWNELVYTIEPIPQGDILTVSKFTAMK